MIATALLLTELLAATPADVSKKYESCIAERATHYAMYCYPLPEIVMAVRGICRRTVSETLDSRLMHLDAHSKREIIAQYMSIMDEVIYRVAMDTRIQYKVDCGQFNDVSPKDSVGTTTKK